jgi:hypothetical protein
MPKRIIDLAEEAVFACIPLLPLQGSDQQGYHVTDTIDPTLRATVEEWAEAAHAVAELHRALRAHETRATDADL